MFLGLRNLAFLGSVATSVSDLFASMYETFNALTSVLPQHLVEWFSGSVLDSIFTFTQQDGSPTSAMADEIDGGLVITSGGVLNDQGILNFNEKRQYEPTGCVSISVWKAGETTSIRIFQGFTGNNFDFRVSGFGGTFAVAELNSGVANFALATGDGSGSRTSSSIARDTNYHSHKVECGSANVKYTIDGVLEVTKTTDRPATKLQPQVTLIDDTGSTNKKINIRYLELFNTDVSILSSLYERLFALTEVMRQRFVETFSGALLNERWLLTIGSSGSGTMRDAIDGGYRLSTGTTANASATIEFNDKRPFDNDGCTMIAVVTPNQTTNTRLLCSLADVVGSFTNSVMVRHDSANSFYTLATNFSTQTSTTVSLDTIKHVHKIVLTASDAKLFIDGVLEATGSTNLPTVKMQPVIEVFNKGITVDDTYDIHYLEVYNTGTTPLVESVYELFNKLTTIAKQHVWEWFSGSVLHNKWTTNNVQGTNTFQMADVINGGFEIITGTTSGDHGSITFNDKRQYAFDASIIIFVMQQITAASYRCQAGFSDSNNLISGDSAYIDNNTDFTNYRLLTFRLGGGTATNTDIVQDLLVHSFKVETKVSSVEGSMDGVLKATNTTNLPAVKMQPAFEEKTLTTAAKTGRIRYLEARNT